MLAASVPGGAASAAPPTLLLAALGSGVPTELAAVRRHRPAVLLFWRTDCAPCLLELQHWRDLRAAAGSEPLVLVAMQPRAAVQAGLKRLGWNLPTFVTAEEPGKVLIRFGGSPPALPLAAMLDRKGNICRVRHGLIGSRTVKQWKKACD
jgi:thiol-disulfide isomerase/thioredoxin